MDDQNQSKTTEAVSGFKPSFGMEAVGIDFNPSGNAEVHQCKMGFANLIDQMDALRRTSESDGQARHASIAITMLEDAQMRAVKAITWRGK